MNRNWLNGPKLLFDWCNMICITTELTNKSVGAGIDATEYNDGRNTLAKAYPSIQQNRILKNDNLWLLCVCLKTWGTPPKSPKCSDAKTDMKATFLEGSIFQDSHWLVRLEKVLAKLLGLELVDCWSRLSLETTSVRGFCEEIRKPYRKTLQ